MNKLSSLNYVELLQFISQFIYINDYTVGKGVTSINGIMGMISDFKRRRGNIELSNPSSDV